MRLRCKLTQIFFILNGWVGGWLAVGGGALVLVCLCGISKYGPLFKMTKFQGNLHTHTAITYYLLSFLFFVKLVLNSRLNQWFSS